MDWFLLDRWYNWHWHANWEEYSECPPILSLLPNELDNSVFDHTDWHSLLHQSIISPSTTPNPLQSLIIFLLHSPRYFHSYTKQMTMRMTIDIQSKFLTAQWSAVNPWVSVVSTLVLWLIIYAADDASEDNAQICNGVCQYLFCASQSAPWSISIRTIVYREEIILPYSIRCSSYWTIGFTCVE